MTRPTNLRELMHTLALQHGDLIAQLSAIDKELLTLRRSEAKRIQATHGPAVKHDRCAAREDGRSCPICDGGLYVCSRCGAAEVEAEEETCEQHLLLQANARIANLEDEKRNAFMAGWMTNADPKGESDHLAASELADWTQYTKQGHEPYIASLPVEPTDVDVQVTAAPTLDLPPDRCTHRGYLLAKHGRRCPHCGITMVDPGD